MIYTITLNPALDRTIFLNDLHFEDANRIIKEDKFAGGKGIDVSRKTQALHFIPVLLNLQNKKGPLFFWMRIVKTLRKVSRGNPISLSPISMNCQD